MGENEKTGTGKTRKTCVRGNSWEKRKWALLSRRSKDRYLLLL
jgi:hypothetical protein